MQVQFTAVAYQTPYQEIQDIFDGAVMPVISMEESKYLVSQGYTVIGEATVTVELFSNDEITSKKLAALQAQLQTVRAENQKRENAILDQISKLQAIDYTGDAAK